MRYCVNHWPVPNSHRPSTAAIAKAVIAKATIACIAVRAVYLQQTIFHGHGARTIFPKDWCGMNNSMCITYTHISTAEECCATCRQMHPAHECWAFDGVSLSTTQCQCKSGCSQAYPSNIWLSGGTLLFYTTGLCHMVLLQCLELSISLWCPLRQ